MFNGRWGPPTASSSEGDVDRRHFCDRLPLHPLDVVLSAVRAKLTVADLQACYDTRVPTRCDTLVQVDHTGVVELDGKFGSSMRILSKLGGALTRCGDCTNATLCPPSKPFFSLESTDGSRTDALRKERCEHIQAK